MRAIVLGIVAMSWAATANAEMPDYDVKAYCKTVADTAGGSAMILRGGYSQEQTSYNKLKPTWETLPAKMQKYCDEVAQVSGGSFMILAGCVQMELKSAAGADDFQFKR